MICGANLIVCLALISSSNNLTSHATVARAKCMMGLFPEIERAWFTVDNKLILWDYLDG